MPTESRFMNQSPGQIVTAIATSTNDVMAPHEEAKAALAAVLAQKVAQTISNLADSITDSSEMQRRAIEDHRAALELNTKSQFKAMDDHRKTVETSTLDLVSSIDAHRKALEASSASQDTSSKRMMWLTVAYVALTAAVTVATIVQTWVALAKK